MVRVEIIEVVEGEYESRLEYRGHVVSTTRVRCLDRSRLRSIAVSSHMTPMGFMFSDLMSFFAREVSDGIWNEEGAVVLEGQRRGSGGDTESAPEEEHE